MRFDLNVAVYGLIGFAILVLPISYFHEIGHKIICEGQGGESRIGFPTNNSIPATCTGSEVDVVLMRFFGGFFGVIGGLIPLAFYSLYKRHPLYLGFLVASLAISVSEFPKSILEPFYYDFYETEFAGIIFLALTLVAWMGFYLLFGRTKTYTSSYTRSGSP